MTKREFMLQHVAYENGMIHAWKHIRNMCNACIKAHKEELKKDRIIRLAEMNRHLWKDAK